jgi:hypothetical protein
VAAFHEFSFHSWLGSVEDVYPMDVYEEDESFLFSD